MIMNRRRFCRAALAPAAAAVLPAEVLLAQTGASAIRVRSLNHVALSVSDLARSVEFYQRLFGAPIQARPDPTTVSLRLGSGPQSLTLIAARPGQTPGIDHYCLGVEDFGAARIAARLAERGIPRAEPSAPMTASLRMRGPEPGGAGQGTLELYLYDPDGIAVQLQDTSYCAGAGPLGAACAAPERAPADGLLAADDLNHVTLSVSDRERSLNFYQDVLGMSIQVYQGATPLMSVGSGPQFVTAAPATATGATPGRPGIAHVCLTVQNFDPERITDALAGLGIEPRQGSGNVVGPMTTFITMRGPDRGGAVGGTPELYFTDPDGVYLQLQDASYCGGSGYLGNLCP